MNDEKKEALSEIASCISNGDEMAVHRMETCAADVRKYCVQYQEQYAARGLNDDADEDLLRWIGLADCLLEYGHACELDWKCEKADYLYLLSALKGMKALPLQDEWFDEDESIVEWCEILDEKWKDLGMCIAAFDIDSDSYVLFPASAADFEKLKELAAAVGQRIELAKRL